MWKKIEPYLSLTIAGLSLILTCDWYLDGREKEALAGLVVAIGAFIYCFKNQIWPEEKETRVQIEQIIGDVKDYQSLEKDIETLKIAFETTPVENHKVRLHFSLYLTA